MNYRQDKAASLPHHPRGLTKILWCPDISDTWPMVVSSRHGLTRVGPPKPRKKASSGTKGTVGEGGTSIRKTGGPNFAHSMLKLDNQDTLTWENWGTERFNHLPKRHRAFKWQNPDLLDFSLFYCTMRTFKKRPKNVQGTPVIELDFKKYSSGEQQWSKLERNLGLYYGGVWD